VKAKYIGKAIRVTGEVNKTYRAIKAKKLEVKKNGSYKIVWPRESKRDDWKKWQKEFHKGRLDGN
jgi:rRNA processing protein Gar1